MKNIGEFEISSGSVYITDPCYDPGIWCSAELDNIKNGIWTAHISISDRPGWSVGRVSGLFAIQIDLNDLQYSLNWQPVKEEIGVDSGQAGIFDCTKYRLDFTKPYSKVGENEYNLVSLIYGRKESLKEFEKLYPEPREISEQAFIDILKEKINNPPEYPLETTTDWYEICCDKTLSNQQAGIVPGGCVSSSGYGNGGYPAYYANDKDGLVNAIKIVFISDEEEEDED